MSRMSIAQALELAQQHLNAGRFSDAGQILAVVVQADPEAHAAHYLQGLAAYRLGDAQAAETCFRRAIALNDQNVDYRNDLSGILNILGRPTEGEAIARQTLAIAPSNMRALNNLGAALQGQKRIEEAIAVFRRAHAQDPDYFEALVNLANTLQTGGQLEEAIELHRRVIARWPHYSPSYLNLGAALQQLKQLDEAIDVYRRMLALEPRNINAYNNLGTVLEQQGKFGEAEAIYHQALALDPAAQSIYYNLGNVLRSSGRADEALQCYRRALAIQPDYYEAQNNLGNVLQAAGRIDEAEVAFRRCAELRPGLTSVTQNLANVLQVRGLLTEAEQTYRRLLEQDEQAAIHSNLGATLQAQGRIEEALTHFHRAIELAPEDDSYHSNRLLCLHYRPGITAAELAVAHAAWQERHAAPRRVHWPKHDNSRDPERALRLGFVSGDFWEHTVGFLVAPLLENLDRREFTVICYYDNARNDKNTARLRSAAGLWRNVCGMSEELLTAQIRSDAVDVLFDLSGHTALNRLRVFARKPAPIQITWAGYVGTTGLEAMDYVLADRYEVPEGEETHYRESILRMPDGYICYGPPPAAPPVGPLPALSRGQVTFGSFNNPAKLNPQVVALWARVLQRVPGSRLLLKYRGFDNPPVQVRFRELFAQCGIGPERLELVAPSLHLGLLEAYNQVDVGLDPFPYSGGITTCEALWMGVPVITCPGATFASRHSQTHLSNAGQAQFVARDFDHYVELAVEWAQDLPRLAAVRAGLRAQLAASPLCDAPRYAQNFQQLMRNAWRRWAGQ